MWKIMLMFLIVAAAGAGGMLLASDLKRRRKDLEQFLFGLRIIEGEMNYETAALGLCFERAGKALKGEVRSLFLDTAEGLKNTGRGEESFLTALWQHRDHLAFTNSDIEAMEHFAHRLGENDLEHAVKDLRRLETRLEAAGIEAETNEKKWGRLFLHSGWLGGLCIVLIFL